MVVMIHLEEGDASACIIFPGSRKSAGLQVGNLACVIEFAEWIDVGNTNPAVQDAGIFQFKPGAKTSAQQRCS